MNESAAMIVYYIQKSLYEGRLANEDGFYIFTRKEIAEGTGLSLGTVSNRLIDASLYFEFWCDLKSWAKYEEYSGEILYTEVSCERGKLKFKRNPITFKSELQHLWALPPLENHFVYDAFDNNHRRRTNSSQPKYDAIPWSWDSLGVNKNISNSN